MTLYFIRHGETYWNLTHKMQGQVNIPLTPKGKAQAVAAAHLLDVADIEVCFTSPLVRAKQTAELVLMGKDVPIIEEPLLIEQNYGLCEGKSQRIGFFNPFSPLYHYERAPEKYHPAIGGEDFDQLTARALAFLEKLLPESPESKERYRSVLVVAHGAIICAILGELLHVPRKDFWSMRLRNCEITVGSYTQGKFVRLGCCHTPIDK